MNRTFLRVISGLVLILLGQGCDMGTGMRLRVNLINPIPDSCIEEVLIKSKPEVNYRKNSTSGDTISSYAFWGQEFWGGIFQEKNEGSIILDIDSSWIGPPLPLEKEKQLEQHLLEFFEGFEHTCGRPEFKNMNCFYNSFYSRESRCPSARNGSIPNQSQQR